MTSLPKSMPKRRQQRLPWQAMIDSLAMLLWGAMLTRFAVTGKLYLLLHPDYWWLSHMAAVLLLGLGTIRAVQVVLSLRRPGRQGLPLQDQEHAVLMPRQISICLLLMIAVFGLVYKPQPFTSETAFQRGITDVLGQTRSSPQRFVLNATPDERTIIDWVRTLNVYPEPDAYTDQPVKVSGFVVHLPSWPDNFFMISRFVLTCCAADAYPVGLPVELPAGESRPAADTWLEVEGKMQTGTLDNKRQLVIGSAALTEIPTPRNPYEY